jgi:pullulanase/glycogen debranching enzyme
VILDVVYNHTAEGNERGPTLSFKGSDNASYYRLLQDDPRYYVNDTGTGNTLNVSHPRVLQMATDSLRYWIQQTNAAEKGKPLTDFVRKLIGLRRKYPILHRNFFQNGQYVEDLDLKDVTWRRFLHALFRYVVGRPRPDQGHSQPGHEATMLLVVNVHHDLVNFVMPASSAG